MVNNLIYDIKTKMEKFIGNFTATKYKVTTTLDNPESEFLIFRAFVDGYNQSDINFCKKEFGLDQMAPGDTTTIDVKIENNLGEGIQVIEKFKDIGCIKDLNSKNLQKIRDDAVRVIELVDEVFSKHVENELLGRGVKSHES